jgi:3-hydroxyisobutyrate dehydrogenase
MSRLGFIGLGTMGHGMALNLLMAGNNLTVWNRTPEKSVDLVCDVAPSPVELGKTSDIVFVCVSDTPDVEEVVFGENGVINGLESGALVVDHSTISPVATRELATRAGESGVAGSTPRSRVGPRAQ